MLVLSRRVGQSVCILVGGEVIKVTVVHQTSGCTKLGFDAPDDVRILREELVESEQCVSANSKGGGDGS
jgi:carbon storage regulator CsrA